MIYVFADMAVEVAIWAFGNAERPMDIKGQRRTHIQKTEATSLAKALALWLIACFVCGAISANVSS